ncbi:hypothetical protein L1887_59544 [Cichorium endivia]|nr:hypothetical protein L1887_59544 [Cichorium endivia]
MPYRGFIYRREKAALQTTTGDGGRKPSHRARTEDTVAQACPTERGEKQPAFEAPFDSTPYNAAANEVRDSRGEELPPKCRSGVLVHPPASRQLDNSGRANLSSGRRSDALRARLSVRYIFVA